ncbi:MAG: hypothetical protein ABIX01_00010 [Chitinophagaceae bacterium]
MTCQSRNKQPIKNLLTAGSKNETPVLLDMPAIKLSFAAAFDIVLEGLVYNKNQNDLETTFRNYLAGEEADFNGLKGDVPTNSE